MRCPCCAVIVFLVLVLWCDDWLVVWVNLAELHRPVQAGRLLTRKSILRMVASQCLLVKHCGVTAEETPLGSFNYSSFIVLNRETDVKNLKYWTMIYPPPSSPSSSFLPDSRCPHRHNTRMPGLHNWNCPHKDKQGFLHVLLGGCQTPLGRGLALGLGMILLGLCWGGNTWLQVLGCDDYSRWLTTEDTTGRARHLYNVKYWYATAQV